MQAAAMSKQLAFLVTAALALSGCSHECGGYMPPPTSRLTNWDGLGSFPTRDKAKFTKARRQSEPEAADEAPSEESQLAALKPYSEEWWSVHDAIDRAAEVRLAKKMVICRNCMPPRPEDQTGSIAPK